MAASGSWIGSRPPTIPSSRLRPPTARFELCARRVRNQANLRGSRFHRRTEGREGTRGRDFGVRAAACEPGAFLSKACCAPIARRTTETSRTSRPPILPVKKSRRFSARVLRTEAARDVPFGETEGRHVSFCKRAAFRQPTELRPILRRRLRQAGELAGREARIDAFAEAVALDAKGLSDRN